MRSCIFCGGKVTSREHAWPEWLLNSVRMGQQERMIAQFAHNTPPKTWNGPRIDVRVRCVCKACNHGWMSDLEGYAKRVIGPLMQDVGFNLDQSAQATISAWSVKTAMVFEFVSKMRPHFYSQVERENLRQSCGLPAETAVWAGRYSHTHWLFVDAHKMSNPKYNSVFSEALVATFAIGRLVVQVLTSRLKPGAAGEGSLPPETRRTHGYLSQIWPISSPIVRWPPAMSFTDSGITLDDASTRFSPRS